MPVGKASSILRDGAVAVPNEDVNQKLNRAKGYPYPRPPRSFLYVDEGTFEFESSSWKGLSNLSSLSVYDTVKSVWRTVDDLGFPATVSFESFTPVLAIGSNASPEQLRRKFPSSLFPDGIVIPVVECVLEDFDVVYCPLLCSYGSCPATLEHSPGSAVSVYITYLDEDAMEHMNATEGAYDLMELSDIKLHVGLPLSDFSKGQQGAEFRDTIYQYNHQLGTMHLPIAGHPQGAPVALAEIPATNRQFPALSQPQVLQAIRYLFCEVEGAELTHLHAQSKNTSLDGLPNKRPKRTTAGQRSGDGSGSSSSRAPGNSAQGGVQLVSSSDVAVMQVVTDSGAASTEAVAVFADQSGTSSLAVKVLHLPGQGVGDSDDSLAAWVNKEGLDDWILSAVTGKNAQRVRGEATAKMERFAAGFRYQKAKVVLHIA